jgi:hypothetical protein
VEEKIEFNIYKFVIGYTASGFAAISLGALGR